MTIRYDPLIKFFNDKGYQPILVSRTGLTPPDVYYLDESVFDRIGTLKSFLSLDLNLPKAQLVNAPDFVAAETRAEGGSAEVSFLQQILQRFGVGAAKAKIDAAVDRNSRFCFENVTIGTLNVSDIENALNGSAASDALRRKETNGKIIHIAYEYMYAGRISISSGNSGKINVELNSDFSQIASIEAQGKTERGDSLHTTYENVLRPATVAFKVGKLTLNSAGVWRLQIVRRSAGFDPNSASRTPYVYSHNKVLSIRDLEG